MTIKITKKSILEKYFQVLYGHFFCAALESNVNSITFLNLGKVQPVRAESGSYCSAVTSTSQKITFPVLAGYQL